ncbi:hypothetical protein COV16_00955, partial [Candidatus Woesearchaeota archaeon CG10_big_fil_rev_8_21_14_0_10_34_8]
PNILLNAKTVTDSTLSRMKTQQDEIKEAVSTMQEAISQGAVNEQFEKEEYKIDTCLKSMKEYEEYMKLIAEMDDIDEQLDVKTDVLYNYVWAEEYNDAREHIDEVQPLIQEMIKNLEKRQATGIEKIPDDFVESWHDYHDAFNLLREFVDWWQERSYRYADDKYEEFSKAIAESLEADAERTWEQTIIEVDGWYENNIRLCVGVLE